MLKTLRTFLILTFGLVLPFYLSALSNNSSDATPSSSATIRPNNQSPVKVELLQEEKTIQPGQPFWIALHINLDEGWHVYWKNPGDAGMPLKIEWNLPQGFEAGPLEWPFPEKFTVADMVGFGYKGEVTLLSQVTPPAELDPQTDLSLKAQIKWLVCSSLTCQPGAAPVELSLKMSSEKPSPNSELVTFFKEAREKIPRTIVEVKTSRKEGIVQLEVPQQTPTSKVSGVDFFPEQKNVIDHSIEPTVAESTSKANRYLVNLKGSDEIGARNKKLKGVLVLHTQKGSEERIQAIDIDSPIEEEGEGLLSLFTPSQTSIGDEAIILDSSSPFSFEGGVSLALVFAFIGGMILNLMPCVLPVMSFKVMSFVKMAGKSRSLTLKHGMIFSLGVILSFWILASSMLILRAYGQSVGWGFQLQEPLFVVFLASVLFVFSLSLFGLFEWGMFLASWAGETQIEATKQSSGGYTGSFFNGVLATAVATPCTGPFLGSAVGFAVTLPIFKSLLIFTSLGLGMSFPYLLLAAFPAYLRFLPKPGAWMDTFKQLMGFLLLATVLWLLWVFSAETDAFSLICLLTGFLFFAIAAWLYGRGCSPIIKRNKRFLSYSFVLLFAVMGCQAILFPRASWYNQEYLSSASKNDWDGWEEFSPERLAQLQREGKPVLIDFTAKWCLICQANHLVLSSDNVQQQLDLSGVVKMKADWTKSDPVITEALSKYGRNSVPLYVLHVPNQKQQPIILPQVLTSDVVLEHLNTALPPEEVALK